mgnify:CR=1 FL=1
MPNEKNNWLNWYKEAVEKTVEAGADFYNKAWKNYEALWKEAADRRQGEELLPGMEKAWRDYLQWNQNTFQEVMGKAREVFEEGKKPKSPPEEPAYRPLELQLSGQAGKRMTSSFNLNNPGERIQEGLFFISGFFPASQASPGEAGRHTRSKEPADITLKIKPTAFTLHPGEDLKVDLQLSIPKATPPGAYRSRVKIEGFEDASFHLLLQVAPPEEKKISPPKKRSK